MSSTLCSQVKQTKQNFACMCLSQRRGGSGDQFCLSVCAYLHKMRRKKSTPYINPKIVHSFKNSSILNTLQNRSWMLWIFLFPIFFFVIIIRFASLAHIDLIHIINYNNSCFCNQWYLAYSTRYPQSILHVLFIISLPNIKYLHVYFFSNTSRIQTS